MLLRRAGTEMQDVRAARPGEASQDKADRLETEAKNQI